MDRRTFVTGLGTILAAPLAGRPATVRAQTPGKGRRPVLGILSPHRRPTAEETARSPTRAKLRELGWTEGQTIEFELAYGDGSEDRLGDLAADLVRKKV